MKTKKLSLKEVAKNKELLQYLKTADNNFAAIGYKEHGLRHARFTSQVASHILEKLGYSKKIVEYGRIAGFLHDIGNAISQTDHGQNGAVLVLDILERMNIDYKDIFQVVCAIGCHEDKDAQLPSAAAAAVVIGDKSDLHSTRVRSKDLISLDTHARVNFACKRSRIEVDKVEKRISLKLNIDTKICPVMEYFEIFIPRMKFCTVASKSLSCDFGLYINNDKFL